MTHSAIPPGDTPFLIKGRNLRKTVGAATLLKNIDIVINPGEIVSLIGPNGAGKTTLVRLVLGLSAPSAGSLQRARDLIIGYVPQSFAIDPSLPLTSERFVSLGATSTKEAARARLREVGVPDVGTRMMTDLSGGEIQRVLLARALHRNPQLLVLDEPAAGLDISGEADLYRLIQDISDQRGCGILLVSHDLHMVMAATDHVICLNQHVCCSGAPAQVTRHPEFGRLFGAQAANVLAPYLHSHNHQHTVSGELDDERPEEAP